MNPVTAKAVRVRILDVADAIGIDQNAVGEAADPDAGCGRTGGSDNAEDRVV